MFTREPPGGYSIDELHAYARANDFPEEAEALQRYLRLRRRTERRVGVRRLQSMAGLLQSGLRAGQRPQPER